MMQMLTMTIKWQRYLCSISASSFLHPGMLAWPTGLLLALLCKSQVYMRQAGRESDLPPSGGKVVLAMQQAVTGSSLRPVNQGNKPASAEDSTGLHGASSL